MHLLIVPDWEEFYYHGFFDLYILTSEHLLHLICIGRLILNKQGYDLSGYPEIWLLGLPAVG